ncbi:MAG: YceD family protein [Hyphomicrobiaceae bacterium]
MSEADPNPPLRHIVHDVTEIPDGGLKVAWKASPEERAVLAQELDVLEIEAVSTLYEIKRKGRARQGGSRYELTGQIKFRLTQACVVSLEPITQLIEETIEEEFRPEEDIEPRGEDESEVLSVNDPEPFVDGKLEVGRLIFEYLSSAIDPFPRKDGESLEWQDRQDPADVAAQNPFAELAKLKNKN